MSEIKNPSIKLKEADHTSLKLELDYKLRSVKLKSKALANINEFMYTTNLYKSCGFEEKYTMDYYKMKKNEKVKMQ